MRPADFPEANHVFRLTGQDGRLVPDADLPVYSGPDHEGDPIHVSLWHPDPGERKAITNGAGIRLTVWSVGHPPVALGAGEPDPRAMRELLDRAHVTRALGHLTGWLEQQFASEGDAPTFAAAHGLTSPAILEAFQTALDQTRDPGPALHPGDN